MHVEIESCEIRVATGKHSRIARSKRTSYSPVPSLETETAPWLRAMEELLALTETLADRVDAAEQPWM